MARPGTKLAEKNSSHVLFFPIASKFTTVVKVKVAHSQNQSENRVESGTRDLNMLIQLLGTC